MLSRSSLAPFVEIIQCTTTVTRVRIIALACMILCIDSLPAGTCAETGYLFERKCSRSLRESTALLEGELPVLAWIFLEEDNDGTEGGSPQVSSRAASRIARRAPDSRPMQRVDSRCVEQLEYYGVSIRYRSRYLNAVSARIHPDDLERVCSLPCVRKVEPVRVFRREIEPLLNEKSRKPSRASSEDGVFEKYGESFRQLSMIESLDLLEAGYNGSGERNGGEPVIICVMDTGFDLLHEALSSVDVLAQYDFVQYDSVTANQAGDDANQAAHGTTVLGVIAGYMEGQLIGPAWGARYLLAKTEILDQEIILEEDKWVAGIEWADSAGADIVTSSVGYLQWYSQEDMDGETCVCTRAADIAASRGIVVVNSVGNYGLSGSTSMIAPADGDSVIAVGAVDAAGVIASFSSLGPTADGRIKPDLVAMGVNVYTVSFNESDGYAYAGGTSYAAPLIAGLCAQLLEIDPDLEPMDLRESLISSSSRSSDPDNTYGYGIPRGYAASGLVVLPLPDGYVFDAGHPNPFAGWIDLELFVPDWSVVTVKIYDCRGSLIRTIMGGETVRWNRTLTWDGRNAEGRDVANGVYFAQFFTRGFSRSVKIIRIR